MCAHRHPVVWSQHWQSQWHADEVTRYDVLMSILQKVLKYPGWGITAVIVIGGWCLLLSHFPVEKPKGAGITGMVVATFNSLVAIGWLIAAPIVRSWKPVLVALLLFANAGLLLFTMQQGIDAHNDSIEPPMGPPPEALK